MSTQLVAAADLQLIPGMHNARGKIHGTDTRVVLFSGWLNGSYGYLADSPSERITNPDMVVEISPIDVFKVHGDTEILTPRFVEFSSH